MLKPCRTLCTLHGRIFRRRYRAVLCSTVFWPAEWAEAPVADCDGMAVQTKPDSPLLPIDGVNCGACDSLDGQSARRAICGWGTKGILVRDVKLKREDFRKIFKKFKNLLDLESTLSFIIEKNSA